VSVLALDKLTARARTIHGPSLACANAWVLTRDAAASAKAVKVCLFMLNIFMLLPREITNSNFTTDQLGRL
jgi:hypothetical protein